MELFRDVKIPWMKYKWYYILGSLAIIVIGWINVFARGGFLYSIDLKGGTIIKAKFAQKPDLDKIRAVLKEKLGAAEITRYDTEEKNQIQIKMKLAKTEEATEFQRLGSILYDTLQGVYDSAQKASGKQDLNKAGRDFLAAGLKQSRVLENMGILKPEAGLDETDKAYRDVATAVIDYRTGAGGLIHNLDELSTIPGVGKPVVDQIKNTYYAGSFTVLSVDSVGPKIGKELQQKALYAVGWALLGMLIYIAFRFKLAFGIGATVALFHDVLITLALLSLLSKEISLTVIAALLTLVGYSTNDTIVVFDRIRENLKKPAERGKLFSSIIDDAVNQTLSRTIITSGLTFVSVFCLWLFGGEALDGFSLVLTAGIIIGTYSSVAIASPVMYWWTKYLGSEKDKKHLKFA